MRISAPGLNVYLSSLGMEDAESIRQNANDKEISLNTATIPYPYEMSHAIAFVEYAAQKAAFGEEYHFGIHLISGELVGVCGLSSIDSVNMKAEIGYWVGRNYWGKGYAKEALKLIIDYGFVKLELNRIYARVFPFNERSINLLGSLGFVREGVNRQDVFHVGTGKFIDDVTFGLLKSEYSGDIGSDVKY